MPGGLCGARTGSRRTERRVWDERTGGGRSPPRQRLALPLALSVSLVTRPEAAGKESDAQVSENTKGVALAERERKREREREERK